MKRLIPILALAATACAGNTPREYPGVQLKPAANPSAVIAAELAFAQLAQTKGQWTAFRETAAADAVMFVPQMIVAQQWLKGRGEPPVAVKWQPHQIWSSCDGSIAVTRGAWQGPKAVGYFTTVWQRQRDGGYKWILDQGDSTALPMDAPEMIEAKVADCPHGKTGRSTASPAPVAFDPAHRAGTSDDGTLVWDVTVDPSGARNFSVDLLLDGKLDSVEIDEVSAPGG
jgi:hypothetical protein